MSNESNRADWIRKQLKALPENSRLLDAGAGEQAYKPFCSHLKYVAQDFAQYAPEKNNSGLQMEKWDYGKLDIISDITTIPEPNESFDAILCSEVFEHIPDPNAAIKEFSRLLKKGGVLILTAPFISLTHFAPYHFSTGFNRYYYEHHLPAAGFRIEELSFNGNYFDVLNQETGRVSRVAATYSNDKPGFLENQALKIVQKMYNRFSSKGEKSTELLAYGIHIRAIKV